jgi:dethiobiotin synthetase
VRLVVLGTGTNVGKTHVSAALGRAYAAARPGARVALLKPVETGISPGQSSDSARLSAASSGFSSPLPEPLFGFPEPISPHLAARRAHAQIELSAIVSWVERFEATRAVRPLDLVLIESAGGAFTPLGDETTNLELARALEPARWLLVAPDALGVLHELSATLTALRATARAPDYVVLSAARGSDASTGTNARELRRLGIADPVAELARDSDDVSGLVTRLL